MEMSLINTSCRNLQFPSFSSPPLPFSRSATTALGVAFSNLPTTVSFRNNLSNNNHSDGFRKPSNFRKTQFNFISLGSSTTRICSLGANEVSGTAIEVTNRDPSLEMKNKAMEISPELKGTSIFLVGMNCTMKTNLGKILADALRYYYFDSDSLVEEAAGGESAAKTFKESDEKGYRESETEVLKQLSSMGRLVVSAGDGAVQSSTNLSLLRYGISIWIDVPLDVLASEVIEREDQGPLTSDEVIVNLNKVYEEMKDGYATADGKVSVQNLTYKLGYEDMYTLTTEDIALEVLKEIEKLTRVKKMMEAAARPF